MGSNPTSPTELSRMTRHFFAIWILTLSFTCIAQCDVDIIDVNLNTYEVTLEIVNSEGCGMQGYGATPGAINMLMIGLHVPGVDEPWDPDGPCDMSPNSNHLGWTYGTSLGSTPNNWANDFDIDMPLYSGDTVVMQLDNPYGTDCVNDPFLTGSISCCAPQYIDYWIGLGECIEVVIWQINYSNTWYAADGGWATTGPNGDGTDWGSTGTYPDQEIDNWWVSCEQEDPIYVVDTVYVELPPDTIEYYFNDTTYLTDTLYIDIWYYTTDTVYQVDTLTQYVELPPDTIYEEEYIYDTTYVYVNDTTYVFDTTYVYQTDTIYEYIVQEIWIDCLTGDLCSEDPPGMEEEQVIYVPNAFSPNNDGVNDAFFAVTQDPEFWIDWEMIVFNRWGDIVFRSFDTSKKWDGSVMGGSHYSGNGVYSWIINARGEKDIAIRLKGSVVLVN